MGNLPQKFSLLIELISFMAKDLQVLQNRIAQYRKLWNDNDKEFNDSISQNCSDDENVTDVSKSFTKNIKDSRSKIDLMPLSMIKEVLKHFTNNELLGSYGQTNAVTADICSQLISEDTNFDVIWKGEKTDPTWILRSKVMGQSIQHLSFHFKPDGMIFGHLNTLRAVSKRCPNIQRLGIGCVEYLYKSTLDFLQFDVQYHILNRNCMKYHAIWETYLKSFHC